jgi:hypothetical protein
MVTDAEDSTTIREALEPTRHLEGLIARWGSRGQERWQHSLYVMVGVRR